MAVTSAQAVAAAVQPAPDPLLSANVYCAGRLCEVVEHLAAPFWRDWRAAQRGAGAAADRGYLWILRYARCGEHLKLRLHCDAGDAPRLRARLAAAQAAYFARLSAAPPASQPRRSLPAAPPLDVEDRASTDYPDRTFLWTAYQRSHVPLGYQPYLDDDTFVALMTLCLGRSTELVLSRLRCGADGASLFAVQRELLLDGLLDGIAALLPGADERALYLLYHRDCLLRYLRKRRQWGDSAAALADLLARFAQRAARQAAATARLREAARARWGWGGRSRPNAESVSGGEAGDWCDALRDLAAYVGDDAGGATCQIDPFADHPAFPVYFKALHALANQAGVDPPNEAFLIDCLLHATAEPALRDRPVRLRPHL